MVLDIGADHGLCSLFLAELGHSVYASEVKDGPFEILCSNIKQYPNLPIQCLLMDGMSYMPHDVNTVLILGMGGQTIYKILFDAQHKLSRLKDIIIEPQSDFEIPIKFLISNGFYNDAGQYIYEKHFYPVLRFTLGKENNRSEFAMKYGPYPLTNKDTNLLKYLKEKLSMLNNLPKNIQIQRQKEIDEMRLLINEAFKSDTQNC